MALGREEGGLGCAGERSFALFFVSRAVKFEGWSVWSEADVACRRLIFSKSSGGWTGKGSSWRRISLKKEISALLSMEGICERCFQMGCVSRYPLIVYSGSQRWR